jgi:hypothetical protein
VKPPTAGPISFPTDSTSSTLPVEVTKPPRFIWQRWIPVRKNCRSEGQLFRLLGRFYMTTYFGAEYFPALPMGF